MNIEEAYIIDSTDTTLTIELPHKKHTCPVCEQRTDKIHDYRLQKFKHIPLLHKSYELFFHRRRYYCPRCTKRFTENVPFLSNNKILLLHNRFTIAVSECNLFAPVLLTLQCIPQKNDDLFLYVHQYTFSSIIILTENSFFFKGLRWFSEIPTPKRRDWK